MIKLVSYDAVVLFELPPSASQWIDMDTTQRDSLSEFAILFTTLQADINHIYPYEASDTPGIVSYPDPIYLGACDRRTLVRSVFAFIEGNAYFLRRMLLASFKPELSLELQLALAEQQIEITGNGTVRKKAMRAGALDLLKLTIGTFTAILPSLNLKASGPNFESLVRSMKVRDRLMHPKSAHSLNVTDEEIRDVIGAYSWFSLSMVDVIKSANASVKNKLLREFGHEVTLNLAPLQPSE
ncbi:hypothetical protein ACX3YC_21210 [Pseudomonas mohnii]